MMRDRSAGFAIRCEWLLALLLAGWALLRFFTGHGRVEHLVFFIAPVLAFANPASRSFFRGAVPFFILGLAYDMMGSFKGRGAALGRMHVCELRSTDLALARLFTGRSVSVQDWLQNHAQRWLDLVCAVPYATFLAVPFVFAAFLYVRDYPSMRTFGWTFLVVNLLGFATHHVYPAAPPWYYHLYGCGVDWTVRASEGPNLARVDAWLGIGYFRSFYRRSNDVFGAFPSLHVAYPLLVVVHGFRFFGWRLRASSIGYCALMCFAAVYLDHHWMVDVLGAFAYVFIVEVLRRASARWRTLPERDRLGAAGASSHE